MLRRFVIVVLLCASTASLAQTKRPFTFEDMMKLKRVNEPIVSPDGKWVVFSAVDVDLAANTKTPHIWIVPMAGGDSRQITNDVGEDRPRFSPDGKRIAYISSKEDGSQIWLVDFDTATGTLNGQPHRLTSISTEADGEIWSPDGKNLVFFSRVDPDCAPSSDAENDACNKQRDEAQEKSKVKAMVFTRLFYRHWNAYTDFKRNHLFVVSAEGGTPRDITPGDYEVPPFSLGGPDDYAISPDGKELAYSSNHDPVEAASTNNDIFVVPLAGGESKKISTSPGSDSSPLYSPDGKWIAWRMQKRGGYESDKFNLVLYDRKSGEIKNLTEDFDAWVESFVWDPHSQSIQFAANEAGKQPIYEVELVSSPGMGRNESWERPHKLLGGFNDDLVSSNGQLLFTRMSVQAPNEINSYQWKHTVRCELANSAGAEECAYAKPISRVNDSLLSQIQMSPFEPFWFTGAYGDKVQGFLLKPPNFDSSKKYPLKFVVHGGPEVPIGDEWSFRWNAELFAAEGYVVIEINFHGSPGYGQKFIDAINGDWGGAPYQDLMLGLDYAEKTYPFIDKDRECAMGGSYGGYMVNWMEGHTDRFKCIVSHDGMFNTEAAYGQTEELWFNEWEFKGTPWSNREMYRKWSPSLFVTNFKTPMLIVHGQKDYRLDVSQAFDLFTTLQRLNVPSKMLYFPDEGHWVLKPQNSQLWYKTVGGWVDSYLKK